MPSVCPQVWTVIKEMVLNPLTAPPGGWEPIPELLEAFRTEFALRLFWGQSGADADRADRYDKFDKILCVLSDKLEPVEITPKQPEPQGVFH